ncbi:uncharacterized protein LOC110098784 [Dendrobium catenatum]|uniref:uncharacterized protein LOC110098784 n=1 Tax=Dendrobium catenatum TaxID=906689 RepID=UPI0009F642A8|nr:uncharacterized protein LOC110098784 [Dendrobium catenatum]
MVGKDFIGGIMNPGVAIHESSASDDLILRVNNFSGVLDTLKGRKIGDDLSSAEVLKEDISVEEGPVEMELQKNKSNENNVEFLEDGITVKLNADMEARNSQILKNSVVIKVLGNNVPFSSSEVVDEVLNGGPWYVNGFIVGMDRWSAAFDPNTFKGISAPVWVRFPCLLLYCWDEDNIARIASCLGTPMYIDGNTFRWSKQEFVRVCVRIDLEKKLLNGVWVDGSGGRFFQRVEYEKIDILCYQCGRVGQNREICPENLSIEIQNQSLKEKEVGNEIGEKNVQEIKSSVISSEYGPWIHVHFNDRRYNRGNVVRKGLNDARLDNSFREDNSRKNNAKVDREIMVNKKDIVEVNDVLAPDSRDVHRKSFGKENSKTAITNSELGISSAAVKVKLAKELKSLGPVNVEHKKKKRGARKKEDSLYLKEIVRDHSIYFIGLMETKLASIDRKYIDYLIGKDWEYYHHPAEGTSGGIMVLWNRNMVSFDIRETSSQEEKRGGKRFLFSKGPREMKRFMVNSDFHDIGSMGPRVASDHSPIVLSMKDKICGENKVFKFEDTWRSYPAAKSIVYNSWMKNDYGDEYSILQRKLKRTMKALFFWNRNKCKNLNVLKETLKKEILDLQNREACEVNWNADDLVLLRNKVHELNVTLRWLSTWWNQRAKVKWHEDGDINSSIFFRILHKLDQWNCILTRWPSVEEIQKVNNEDLAMLNEELSVQELQISVFQQGYNKAPGIDGVTSSFYKSYWSIVWEVLWNAVNCFFKTGILNREWKNTLITLISKVKYPLLPSNYRPISLCQTNYKIVASMLVNRLKKVIDKMVYEEQAAFIPGRSISVHCLLAQEIFHKFKLSNNRNGLMALKLDMEQAYDSMGWSTLHQVLKWYGIPTLFSNLLMECVVDVRFSIIINGRNSNWICAKSGFRQGCPLSPYLFILCSQLLSNSLEQRGKNLGIHISPRGPRISHLLYADDVLILSHVSTTLAKELKNIVEDFCKWTGQRVNINKSQVLFGKMVSYSLKKKITRIIGFKEVKEMKYLGVKISLRRNKVSYFQELLSMVMDKLNSWGKKSLSMGGKITLIETSLLSMSNFLITHSLVSKRVLYEIEKLCRNFLWHKSDGSKCMHYVAWSEICKPRSMGGLGLQSPLLRIGALRSRLAWNFIQKKDSLLHRTMKAKYGDEIMKDDHKAITSTAWKILLDGSKNLKKAIRWKVGKGNKISVLNDAWLLDKSINRWPTYVDYNVLEGMFVQQLLTSDGDWNFELLRRAFHSELILLIVQVLTKVMEEENIELLKWCSGKTVYAPVYEQMLNDRYNFVDVEYFKWLRKLKLSKKVEIFWWRLGKASIPTNLFLKNHKISLLDSCERGCQEVESYEHIMVHCKYMVEIIKKIQEWGIMIPVFNSLEECLHELKRLSTSNSGIAKVYCSVIYLSWKNRNYVKHCKEALPASLGASNALFLAVLMSTPYLSSWGTNLLRESSNNWCPPPKEWIKINLDASLLTSNLGGIGGIF